MYSAARSPPFWFMPRPSSSSLAKYFTWARIFSGSILGAFDLAAKAAVAIAIVRRAVKGLCMRAPMEVIQANCSTVHEIELARDYVEWTGPRVLFWDTVVMDEQDAPSPLGLRSTSYKCRITKEL